MLIAEHFFLIACDPRTGMPTWPHRQQEASLLAAAALVLDLVAQERLRLHDGLLHADTHLPLTHPLLSQAHHLLQTHGLQPLPALRLLAHRLDPLPQQVLDGLFRRDLVHRSQIRDWLRRKQLRYPLRSVQARNEALQYLREAAQKDDGDLHGLALLMLADISGLLPLHLQARDHESAVRRLLALNDANAETEESRRICGSIRSALLA
jgi:hypothetical protein